jgi:phosphate transport system protein
MPREMFERELQRLQDEVLAMASMVEEAITESVDTLKRRDMEGSRRVIAADRLINKKRFDLEADCLVAIATQQPMASDLRKLAAILNIITELERIGDYAKGIGRINQMIGEEPLIKPLIDIPRMADHVREMLHQAIEAFARHDVALARAVAPQDEVVDALYEQVYRELMTYVIADPRNIKQANYLLWAAHNLERAADRTINICERVIFTVTGQMSEIGGEDAGIESLA